MADYEIVIIGGGPAGLSAGLYAARARLRTLLLEGEVVGGQAATTSRVANYPGFPEEISGPELMQRLQTQAQQMGLEIKNAMVQQVEDWNGEKVVTTAAGKITAGAVIVASGVKPRSLDVPGERELRGRGVSYCATCDGAFFRGKEVLVIGGGDSAVEEALFLTRFARTVTIVHRRDALRATPVVQEEAKANQKIKFLWNSVVTEIKGRDHVEEVVLRDVHTGALTPVRTDGVFVYIGNLPNTAFLDSRVQLDQNGYIVTDERMQTSVPGIFAAGDVRQKPLRQIVTATSDGAIAAVEAGRYLELRGRKA